MSLFNPSTWFKDEPQPIQVNPGNAQMLARHAGRLANLYSAQQREPSRSDVRAEIEQRKNAIAQYGHAAPKNELEARELLKKVMG